MLKSTLSGLHFCPRHYGSIFIHLAFIASQHHEMRWNSDKIWPYSSSRSGKVTDLGVNGKPICDFLLVINCNYSRICYRFEIFTLKDRQECPADADKPARRETMPKIPPVGSLNKFQSSTKYSV